MDMIRRLIDASVLAEDGCRYVRAGTACRIIGVGGGCQYAWEHDGHIQGRRLRVPISRKASHGLVVAWPLEQVIAKALRYRSQSDRSWTQPNDDFLVEHLGSIGYVEAARRLRRTIPSVHQRAQRLGIGLYSVDGAYIACQLADMLGVHPNSIQYWCEACGLKHRHSPTQKRTRLIDLSDVMAFFARRPDIWSHLHEDIRRSFQMMASEDEIRDQLGLRLYGLDARAKSHGC